MAFPSSVTGFARATFPQGKALIITVPADFFGRDIFFWTTEIQTVIILIDIDVWNQICPHFAGGLIIQK